MIGLLSICAAASITDLQLAKVTFDAESCRLTNGNIFTDYGLAKVKRLVK
ncbi:MAG: hypothetical protein WCZ90_20215 [Melioribacteraceae bacterium]